MGMTRSSSKPSNRRAAAWRRSASSTRSAICCSAAAPRSRRCAIRRASSTGDVSSPAVSRISAARSSQSGVLELRVLGCGHRVGRRDPPDAFDEREAQDLSRIEQEGVASSAVDRGGELGQCAFEDAGRLEEPQGQYVALGERAEQELGGVAVPPQRCLTVLTDPGQEVLSRPHPVGHQPGRFERDLESQLGGRLADEVDHAVVGLHPAVGRPPGRVLRSGPAVGPDLAEAPAQERRRHERGEQHHQEQRAVEVLPQDPFVEADGGEDQPDLAAGDHAQPDQPLVAR